MEKAISFPPPWQISPIISGEAGEQEESPLETGGGALHLSKLVVIAVFPWERGEEKGRCWFQC